MKIVIGLITITMIVASLTGCISVNYNLPIYEMTNDSEGIRVNIDGVIYQQYNNNKWNIYNLEKR